MKHLPMMKRILLSAGVAVTMVATSCNNVKDNSPKTEKVIAVGSFSAIQISARANAEVYITPGSDPSLSVKATTSQMQHLVSNVQNNTLVLSTDSNFSSLFGKNNVPEIVIKTPSLEALSLEGIVSVNCHGPISGKEFKLDVSGAATTNIETLNVEEFSTVISGAGNIDIKNGKTAKANYQVSGTGKINTYGLQTTETIARITGAAKAEVNASNKLLVNISGTGYVKYKGNPSITEEISGAGKVIAAEK
jgi:hypothetical protein